MDEHTHLLFWCSHKLMPKQLFWIYPEGEAPFKLDTFYADQNKKIEEIKICFFGGNY
jgi:hypothetical protein